MAERFIVSGYGGAQRLDRVLRARYPQSGRQAIQQLIGGREVLVNGRPVWLASWQLKNGDEVTVLSPPAALPPQPERFDPAWLLADEGDILVIDKPAGLLSEPKRGSTRPSLLELARAHFGALTLFHRLDRDTSGVLLLTRGGAINAKLTQAFRAGLVRKEYVAVVRASTALAASGRIDARLRPSSQRRDCMEVAAKGGQRALTRYNVVAVRNERAWVQLFPETGRQHQLRVHLAHLGAPILGDRLYGDRASAPRLMLHAFALTLPATIWGEERRYVAPLPPEFSPPEIDEVTR